MSSFAYILIALTSILVGCKNSIELNTTPDRDLKAPVIDTFTIASGVASVSSQSVSVELSVSDASPSSGLYQMRINENATFTNDGWQTFKATGGSFSLSDNHGSKTVYVWVKDKEGNISSAQSVSISLLRSSLLSSVVMKQEQGSLSLTNRLHIKGVGIDQLSSVSVSSYGCSMISQTSLEVVCEIQASLAPAWYDVLVKDINQTPTTLSKVYAAGAIAIGQSNVLQRIPVDLMQKYRPNHLFISPENELFLSSNSYAKINKFNSLPSLNTASDLIFGRSPDSRLNNNVFYNYNTNDVTKYSISGRNPMCRYGSKFVIADSINHRILIYSGTPSSWNSEPEFVLGQPDFYSVSANAGGTATNKTLNAPFALWCDSNKIIVADSSNHRVLIWSSAITSDYQSADVVIGQADFTSVALNRGAGTCAANSLYTPRGLYSDGIRLFISDYNNHRILIFNSIPATSGASADKVLGQTSFTVRSSGITQAKLYAPTAIKGNSSYLYVVELGNHRVMAWSLASDISTWANGRSADIVFGQANFTSNGPNQNSAVSASSLWGPADIAATNTKLYISDYENYRVLGWNALPTTNGQAADFVLGQSSATRNDSVVSLSNKVLSDVRAIYKAPNGKYWLFDYENRILRFPGPMDSNNQEADLILGQPDFTSSGTSALATSTGLRTPFNGYVDPIDGAIMSVDSGQSRILIWTTEPTTNNQAANIVLGQPDFITKTAGITASKLNAPRGACRTGNSLFIADAGNNRLLRFTYPLSTAMSADLVLGQSNFTSGLANAGGSPTSSSLNSPYGIYCDSNKLIVADTNNNRVLIWNSLPTSNNQPVDIVVGQNDFTSNSVNPVLSWTLNKPRGVTSDGVKLIVGENSTARLLVWNTFPTTNGASADKVIGQNGDFTTNYLYCNLPNGESSFGCTAGENNINYLGSNLINSRNQIIPIP